MSLQMTKEIQTYSHETGRVVSPGAWYKNLLNRDMNSGQGMSPALLTFLDLYHFPLRGLEQAEFMAERIPELTCIYKNG